MENGCWPDECFTKSRRPFLQQGAEEYADQQLPKHIPERGPVKIPWTFWVASAFLLVSLGILGYAIGYSWTIGSVG
jgi:hypothetical protein